MPRVPCSHFAPQPQPHVMINYRVSAAVVRCLGAMKCAHRLFDIDNHEKLAADSRAAAAASLGVWLQQRPPRQLIVGCAAPCFVIIAPIRLKRACCRYMSSDWDAHATAHLVKRAVLSHSAAVRAVIISLSPGMQASVCVGFFVAKNESSLGRR